MTKVIGLGAGGHAKVVMEILRLMGGYELEGLLDAGKNREGGMVLGVPVLGGDELLSEIHGRGVRHAFIGVGTVGDVRLRIRLYKGALGRGFEIVSVVHPQAVVSHSARFGRGVTVMAGAVVNAAARIGDNVIINTGAIVEHDGVIGNHAHIAAGARLGGGVRVGNGSHVGIGASVRQGVSIGQYAVVGAGAAVVEDVPDNVVVAGVPARALRDREE